MTIISDADYIRKLAEFSKDSNVPELQEHCARLLVIAERLEPMPCTEEDIFKWLCKKYVQRADDRQKSMGLQYTTAETHDLAKEITIKLKRFLGE